LDNPKKKKPLTVKMKKNQREKSRAKILVEEKHRYVVNWTCKEACKVRGNQKRNTGFHATQKVAGEGKRRLARV